jgi:hypothetical protein
MELLQSYLTTDDEDLCITNKISVQKIHNTVILVWAQRKNIRTHIAQIINSPKCQLDGMKAKAKTWHSEGICKNGTGIIHTTWL